MGKVIKNFVKLTVAAAAVGGLCYAFKDKIKDSQVYKDYDVDNKLKKVKTTIKEKMPKVFDNEEDYVDEDEIFFDDLDLAAEDVERDYVSIDPDADAAEAKQDETSAVTADDNKTSEKVVPTIEL